VRPHRVFSVGSRWRTGGTRQGNGVDDDLYSERDLWMHINQNVDLQNK
jgi:hypothetical protein